MQRACHITGTSGDEAQFLRFVTAPDGTLTPDLAGKLPDGGAPFYVLARRRVVAQLQAGQAGVDLADLTFSLMRRQALSLLSLARKAGRLVLGFAKVEAALTRGEVALLLAARDGAANGKQAMAGKAKAMGVAICAVFDRQELGMALGRANVIHAGLTDAVWAARMNEQALRLIAYDELDDGEPAADEMQVSAAQAADRSDGL